MKQSLRILHLEDNPADAELVKTVLEEESIFPVIIRVETREEYQAALERGDFDLIISDFSLPDFDGLSSLDMAGKKCPEKPFIFVSGTLGEETAIESLKWGATD